MAHGTFPGTMELFHAKTQPLEAKQCFLNETMAHSFLEEHVATKFCGTVRFPIISYLPAILDPFLGIAGELGIN